MRTQQTNIRVAVRVRPLNSRESESNHRCVIKILDETTILFDPDEEDDGFFFQGCKQNYRDISKRVNKKLTMEYDRVFDTNADNTDIFKECTAPLVDGVLNGYNSSVFVYGATGAGKTFTMLGNDSCPGLTYLTMRDLFQKIEAESVKRKFEIGVSYLEVYNEQVMNLLTKEGPLKLREDTNGVIVSGLALCPIRSADELLDLLQRGNANRTQHPTDANAESSRSHAIFQVHLRMTDPKTGSKRTVKLSMIDLAGSERASSTKGCGARFKEGASINKSLLALGNCINKLADGLKHIPYRDSNLTRILKDSLGGNCQTLMVANVSMSSMTYEDTYNTLKYASRAKKIRINLRQNTMKSNMPKEFYIKKVTDLVSENDKLKEMIKTLESMTQRSSQTGASNVEIRSWHTKLDAAYAALIKAQEDEFHTKSKMKHSQLIIKLKRDAEGLRSALCLGQENDETDTLLFDTAIHRLEKQVEKQKLDLLRRRKRHQDAFKALELLSREALASPHTDQLAAYLKVKDAEVEHSKQLANLLHVSNINSELVGSSKRIMDSLSVCCELIQISYERLASAHLLSPDLAKKFESLQRDLVMHNTVVVDERSSDEEDARGSSTQTATGSEDDLAATNSKRRRLHQFQRDTDFDLGLTEDEMASKSSCLKSLTASATAGIDEGGPTSGRRTFKVPSARTTSARQRVNDDREKVLKAHLVNNILSDTIAQVPYRRDHIEKALINSKNFNHLELTRTVAVGAQKENKKVTPNRVRKSPRSTTTKVATLNTIVARKQEPRTVQGHGAPMVRLNRAASIRARK